MQADILLTLKLHDKIFADPRRINLLKQVALTGSISQGAKLAGISYKSAWDAINEMNQLGDKLLVERATGGKGGGGAQVTPYGERLIALYDLLGQIQQKAFDALSDDALPLDSLLAAIARFSLQTSARNQWFGEVVSRDAARFRKLLRLHSPGAARESTRRSPRRAPSGWRFRRVKRCWRSSKRRGCISPAIRWRPLTLITSLPAPSAISPVPRSTAKFS